MNSRGLWIVGVILIALSSAATAEAAPIAPGGSLLGLSVPGTTSIYAIFGHADPGFGSETPAVLVTFGAGPGNVFSFSASGLISCCSNAPNSPPDGTAGGTNITGANGLSNISGNSRIPLVGVFTTDTDPFGSVAPAALAFDSSNPSSLSPLLHQVFYIGDGKSGFQNAAGATLTFTAPATATRLYLGVIDALGFAGSTGYYHDNRGAFAVNVSLAPITTPEPSSLVLLALGLSGFALIKRFRSSY